jgi:release factor glutamine methyltransferase
MMRAAIHFFSYHFILNRRRTTHANVAGFRLIIRPMVFHPRYFLTSAFFARFVLKLDLNGKSVADVGTGSGILALAAARAGAASVLALDINPNAAQAAVENAHANGFGGSVRAIGSNLLSAITPRPLFALFCRAHPPLRANLATWPTALGTLVRTTETSRCYSRRRGKGLRLTAACTCSSPRTPILAYSETI